MDNQVIDAEDCHTPEDLTCLADAVFAKTGRQQLLVEQLAQHYAFRTASPNEGHLLAAALLMEGAIVSILTLNFDLALTSALAFLRAGTAIGIIQGPGDFGEQKAFNLYYLHRNANEPDSEQWILRTGDLESNWKNSWEHIVAGKVLSTPVVIFVGLGSRAAVLTESVKMIRKAIPDRNRSYLVDPGTEEQSEFFAALNLDPSGFIQRPWCGFMGELSNRLVLAQTRELEGAAKLLVARENLAAEDIDGLLARFQDMGLLDIGSLRAKWLMEEARYASDEPNSRELVADLLLAAATFARTTGTIAFPFMDGVVEFRKDDRIVDCRVFISGKGTHSIISIEGELSARESEFRRRATSPNGAIVSATRDNWTGTVANPGNVLSGNTQEGSIMGNGILNLTSVDSLRQSALQKDRAGI